MKKLILASSSKTRLSILKTLGFNVDLVLPSNINEDPKKKEKPGELSERLAREKAEYIFRKLRDKNEHHNCVIIGADTVVAKGVRIADKANNAEELAQNMMLLSGSNHVVYSGVSIINVLSDDIQKCDVFSKLIKTRVKFKSLSELDIKHAIKSADGIGYAGGYSVVGIASSFIIGISGSVSCIQGLPAYQVRNALISMGVKTNFDD